MQTETNLPFTKYFFNFSIAFVLALSTVPFTHAFAQGITPPGTLLCAPGFFTEMPTQCNQLSLTDGGVQDKYGFSILNNTAPTQYKRPDPMLNVLDTKYYLIDKNTGTQFYPSIDAAREKTGAVTVISPGDLIYVVYNERIDTEKGTFFLLPNGLYMPGDGSTVTVATPFPGIEITTQPTHPFGFVFTQVNIYPYPNETYASRAIGQMAPVGTEYPVVEIFATMRIKGENWHMIGPNQWVPGRGVAMVTPKTSAPEGVPGKDWIDVDLAEQSLAVYQDNTLIYATVMASGAEPLFTRPGLFQVYEKKASETMTGERNTSNFYYLENVPWTMYFDKARALHGAYWRARLGFPQSHGCVNLYPGDAHWLFNWAEVGSWVNVYDSTGKTPTDPKFYGDGGA